MAKELPYFKFEPQEWQNGNIQMHSDEAKILFIELCCTYWIRLADLPKAMAIQKHCKRNPDLLDELVNSDMINIKDDKLVIKFLDIQLKDVKKKSKKASENAKKRWNKNANAMQTHMQTHSEGNAIRRDKIRKEENKEDKNSGYGIPGVSLKP